MTKYFVFLSPSKFKKLIMLSKDVMNIKVLIIEPVNEYIAVSL